MKHGFGRCPGLLFWLLFLLALAFSPGFAQKKTTATEVLVLGPIPETLWPTFQPESSQNAAREFAISQIYSDGLPQSDQAEQVAGQKISWQVRQTAAALDAADLSTPLWFVAVNAETVRFSKGSFQVHSEGSPEFYLNKMALKAKSTENGISTFDVNLANGSHSLLIILKGAQKGFEIAWEPESPAAEIIFHTEPHARVNAQQLFFGTTVSNMDLSPDGKWVALTFREWDTAKGSWSQRMEIRDFKNKELIHAWAHAAPENFCWNAESTAFAYQMNKMLWVQNLDEKQPKRVSGALENINLLEWHPTEPTLMLSIEQEGAKDPEGVKRYRALEDRWQGWRNVSQLGCLELSSGLITVLTKEPFGATLLDLSSDGKAALFLTSPPDYSKPPFQPSHLKQLDLESGAVRELGIFDSLNDAKFATEGYFISAGPNAFGGIGLYAGSKTPGNDFDTQLFLWDGASPTAKPLTKFFDPSINAFEVLENGDALLLVTEGDQQTLYHYQTERQAFRSMNTQIELVESFDVSRTKKPRILLKGTSATQPQTVLTMVLDNSAESFLDPAEGHYANTYFGDVKPWNFTNEDGFEITGRYYTPPGFSKENRYPLLVYYYGGTVPVNRQFTGRYPFNLWAAHGYVVYVLQPSGTVGMGQPFSALHVNAWGKKTAEDILTGTGQFIRAHTFIDSERVGCLGASYGGFMTMNLLTKTGFFKAAISHAGISDLSGYWGEGWWGYSYSGTATRGTYPWDDSNFYSDVSPLTHADKITTPLLLLHGDADTNVPPGQSHAMYTALKLLGKPVEFVTFAGENHHINNPKLRLFWWDTILAWFDMQLKNQPEWWQHLYPEKQK